MDDVCWSLRLRSRCLGSSGQTYTAKSRCVDAGTTELTSACEDGCEGNMGLRYHDGNSLRHTSDRTPAVLLLTFEMSMGRPSSNYGGGLRHFAIGIRLLGLHRFCRHGTIQLSAPFGCSFVTMSARTGGARDALASTGNKSGLVQKAT